MKETRTHNSGKPPCVNKPASTPVYCHTVAVPRPVSGHVCNCKKDEERRQRNKNLMNKRIVNKKGYKMKIIAILGSPTKDGNTCVMAREVLNGAQQAGADVEEIFLADYKIEFCKGCISKNVKTHCMATGKCIINDDVNMLKEKLYAADGVVLSSPSYGMMETARMKNFLVDRIGMYTAYTSSLGGKYFIGVSTCGGIGAKKVAQNMAKHFIAGFHKRAYMSGYIAANLGYSKVEEHPVILKRAYMLGSKLVNDIRIKRKYPFQKLFDRILFSLIVRKIILKNIYTNKDGIMKAVYENLISRKLIKAI